MKTEKELQEYAEKFYFNDKVTEIYGVEGGHFFHVHAGGAAREFAGDKNIFLLKKGAEFVDLVINEDEVSETEKVEITEVIEVSKVTETKEVVDKKEVKNTKNKD
jgi:hypothetical protein